MRTLLLAQRVDRTFKATIDGSVKLQRKLWFLPDTCVVEGALGEEDMAVNPLLDDSPGNNKSTVPFDVRKDPYSELDPFRAFVRSELPKLRKQLEGNSESWRRMQLVRPQNATNDFISHIDVCGEDAYREPIVCRDWTLECTVTAGQLPGVMLARMQEAAPGCFDNEGKFTAAGMERFLP